MSGPATWLTARNAAWRSPAPWRPNRALEILVRGIRDARNLSILLIEHDMSMVMSLSDRIYVMEYGSCIASGKPGEVRANPRVIKAYLGESDA